MRQPALEGLGLGFVRTQNDGVEARFVDDGFVRVASNTLSQTYGIFFVVIESVGRVPAIGYPEGVAHILEHPPRFPALAYDADLSRGRIEEHLRVLTFIDRTHTIGLCRNDL